ncbi:MAG: hypothetical protein QWI73_04855 [Alphaproteobacteria bacterium]|nr:hypothetical protein [Alphaproteobacteria bacterium]
MKWVKCKGKNLSGLVVRRSHEASLWSMGITTPLCRFWLLLLQYLSRKTLAIDTIPILVFCSLLFICGFVCGYSYDKNHILKQELKLSQTSRAIEHEVENRGDIAVCLALGGLRKPCRAQFLQHNKPTADH